MWGKNLKKNEYMFNGMTAVYLKLTHCKSTILQYKIKILKFNFFFFLVFCLFRAAPAAYGGSQARDLIRAIADGLHHSHNAGSELRLRPTPQLTATSDP